MKIDIRNLTQVEKSILLLEAQGWRLEYTDVFGTCWKRPGEGDHFYLHIPNLYHQKFIAMAWDTLNWAAELQDEISAYSYPFTIAESVDWFFETQVDDVEIEPIWRRPLKEAMALILDSVLEILVEGGVIKGGDAIE